MSSAAAPDDPSLLVSLDEQGLWFTAVQLQSNVDLAYVLGGLSSRLCDVSAAFGVPIQLMIEPDGDACETGHWVSIECCWGVVWAEITPWPQRHGGVIPPRIDRELELGGWVLVRGERDDDLGPRHDPADIQRVTWPGRRLVAGTEANSLGAWASSVIVATRRVIIPTSARWYLYAQLTIPEIGQLDDDFVDESPLHGRWAIDVSRLLEPCEWERAVWPAESETGLTACGLGLHQFHEPPCRIRSA